MLPKNASLSSTVVNDEYLTRGLQLSPPLTAPLSHGTRLTGGFYRARGSIIRFTRQLTRSNCAPNCCNWEHKIEAGDLDQ